MCVRVYNCSAYTNQTTDTFISKHSFPISEWGIDISLIEVERRPPLRSKHTAQTTIQAPKPFRWRLQMEMLKESLHINIDGKPMVSVRNIEEYADNLEKSDGRYTET